MKNTSNSVVNGYIIMKFFVRVVHDKTITKQNSKLYTDLLDKDDILLKSEGLLRKALNFKRLCLSSLWMKHYKIGSVTK